MGNLTVNAVVLKASDYLDNDKMLLLFGTSGKFFAHIRGVKKGDAKLKFAAQPFCFGEFELVEKNGRFLVVGCREIESFFNIGKDADCYYAASTAAEFVSVVAQENEPDLPLFLLLVRALQLFCKREVNPVLGLVKFLLDGLKLAGFGLSFDCCNACGESACGRMFVDMERGGVVCVNCKSDNATLISPAVLNAFRMIDNTPQEKLGVLKIQPYLSQLIAILATYIQNHLKKLAAIQFLY